MVSAQGYVSWQLQLGQRFQVGQLQELQYRQPQPVDLPRVQPALHRPLKFHGAMQHRAPLRYRHRRLQQLQVRPSYRQEGVRHRRFHPRHRYQSSYDVLALPQDVQHLRLLEIARSWLILTFGFEVLCLRCAIKNCLKMFSVENELFIICAEDLVANLKETHIFVLRGLL